ncbi:ABC transporter substrate-binding protein [Haloquadratum walsbyi]|jgi:NitT/TauT family transport system substrate-binding protein|uniref:ABC-type transport system periplasmic substrate-binding protein (Probable substrate nitrate/sulfonate/bicarbonate) n=1 Tax=Haloquadratum walsbyi (strain DSM 16790 / HBSQ001) TaxID=362976 RepID=Q18H04_HALWD|nr:ABC transporter substrate-binding protein [Haloquadratum walsbyi]CAJ52741.1 ABC-type transport system periplasmic substrate-binding protein (probable substrate nitrate/sulfonate/bicarbonate) [Haloquadratum walsbyi DSM 16790]
MSNRQDSDQTYVSRRRVLQASGAVTTAGIGAFAGCSGTRGGSTGASNSGIEEIRVAYMPIYPDMQYFVMKEEGYFDAIDADVTGEVFSDGPSIVQASATGDFDVMMFGIVPAMIIMDKGIPSKITGANIQNAMEILARDSFASIWENAQSGAEAFAQFEAERGRKFTFGTFPPGSVPDILLRYWLTEIVGVEPGSDVSITPLGGAGPVRQALLSSRIDGTSIMEPVPTVASMNDAPYQSIAWAGDFMPGQPAAVTLMHDRLRSDNPEVAQTFIEQHQRATAFAKENPDTAAAHASTVIGESVLPVETARRAIDARASDFITDPHNIADGAKIFSEYAAQAGKIDSVLSNDQLFDFSVYDSV